MRDMRDKLNNGIFAAAVVAVILTAMLRLDAITAFFERVLGGDLSIVGVVSLLVILGALAEGLEAMTGGARR